MNKQFLLFLKIGLLSIELTLINILSQKKSYIIKIRHNKVEWEVVRSYKELREVHKKLTKLVKLHLGVAPHNISK